MKRSKNVESMLGGMGGFASLGGMREHVCAAVCADYRQSGRRVSALITCATAILVAGLIGSSVLVTPMSIAQDAETGKPPMGFAFPGQFPNQNTSSGSAPRPVPANVVNRLPSFLSLSGRKSQASFPVGNFASVGFRANVSLITSPEPGFATVRLTAQSAGPLAADRPLTLSVRSQLHGYSPARYGISFRTDLTLPQGMTAQTFEYMVPKPTYGSGMEVQLIEDGDAIDGYTAQLGNLISPINEIPPRALENEVRVVACYLYSDANAENDQVSRIDSGIRSGGVYSGPVITSYQNGRYYSTNSRISGTPSRMLTALGANDALADWRQYQYCDLMFADAATIRDLDQAKPDCAAAIRHWVHAGGTLVIVGKEPKSSVAKSGLARLYKTAVSGDPSNDYRFLKLATYLSKSRGQSAVKRSETLAKTRLVKCGAGGIIRVGMLESSNVKSLDEFIEFRMSPTLRRGVDPILGDSRFSRWLVPGVSQPPVYTFMALLTVFVILVGPVAYRKTSKAGRSYLMFLIAPVLAIGTTLAMFAYGVVSDGFGTSVRVRQLTWVDGRSGAAMERVRATYFAGIRPGGGLNFPADAEVFEYRDGEGTSWDELSKETTPRRGAVTLRGDSLNYDSSFLPSRQQRQFVTLRPRVRIGSLELTDAPAKKIGEDPKVAFYTADPPTIRNGFDFDLDMVIARDSAGRHWQVESLAAGQSTTKPIRMGDSAASETLGKLYIKHRLVSERASQRNQGWGQIRDLPMIIASRIGASGTVPYDGVFEQQLQSEMQTGSLSKGSFIATAQVSDDAIAVEDADPVHSVRFVFGTLP